MYGQQNKRGGWFPVSSFELASWESHNKRPHTEWIKTPYFFPLTFCRPELHSQSFYRAVLPLMVQGRVLPASSSFSGLQVSRACGRLPPASASIFAQTSSVCVFLHQSVRLLFSQGHRSHRLRIHPNGLTLTYILITSS